MNNLLATTCISLSFLASTSSAETSLLDEIVKEYKVGYADLWTGKTVDQRKVHLDGEEIDDYLFAHAPSRILYDIPSGVTQFSAWGVRPTGDLNIAGTWIYIVKIDGKEVFRSKPLEDSKDYEIPINVPIPEGSKEIELIVEDMSNQYADHSIWARPSFKR